jgi:hypothetical protein
MGAPIDQAARPAAARPPGEPELLAPWRSTFEPWCWNLGHRLQAMADRRWARARSGLGSLMRFLVPVGGVLVVVGDQGTLDRRADLPVEPDHGVEGEQALHHASPQPCRDAAAGMAQAQLVLERPDDRLDPRRSQAGKTPPSGSSARGGRTRHRVAGRCRWSRRRRWIRTRDERGREAIGCGRWDIRGQVFEQR